MWSANLASGKMGRAKSVPLKDLGALCDKSIQFVSLQNYEYGRDFETVPELNIIDLSSALTDFDETAAVISNCDLVISVDTSVAHLSAAMGKPTWIALRYAADWRYLYDREHCVWYPSVRLFRQESEGEWRSVIEDIGKSLRTWCSDRAEA